MKTFGVDLQIANDVDADIIHAHTWYTCLEMCIRDRLGAVELDVGDFIDFRHQVVVVGGEPLLHRQRSDVALVSLVAAARCV